MADPLLYLSVPEVLTTGGFGAAIRNATIRVGVRAVSNYYLSSDEPGDINVPHFSGCPYHWVLKTESVARAPSPAKTQVFRATLSARRDLIRVSLVSIFRMSS